MGLRVREGITEPNRRDKLGVDDLGARETLAGNYYLFLPVAHGHDPGQALTPLCKDIIVALNPASVCPGYLWGRKK